MRSTMNYYAVWKASQEDDYLGEMTRHGSIGEFCLTKEFPRLDRRFRLRYEGETFYIEEHFYHGGLERTWIAFHTYRSRFHALKKFTSLVIALRSL